MWLGCHETLASYDCIYSDFYANNIDKKMPENSEMANMKFPTVEKSTSSCYLAVPSFPGMPELPASRCLNAEYHQTAGECLTAQS